MQQKHAIITGASSGIGLEISKELAKKNYSIVAVSNQPDKLAKLKQDWEKEFGIDVHTIDCDLTDKKSSHLLFDYCKENNISVEVLVNNAGILTYGEAIDVPVEKAEAILSLHMSTPAILCRLFGEEMAKNGGGYILNVSSISAVMPFPLISFYGPTKGFLKNFSTALRTELKRKNVSVTCLLPGATSTSLYEGTEMSLKESSMKKPDYVAQAGVKAMFRKKRQCIPGFLNKITVFLVPIVPNWLVSPGYQIYAKRKDRA